MLKNIVANLCFSCINELVSPVTQRSCITSPENYSQLYEQALLTSLMLPRHFCFYKSSYDKTQIHYT